MQRVSIGEWLIDVDVEATKEYYRNINVDTTAQGYRNYVEYCKTFSTEEKSFFESFGINPSVCKVTTIGMDNEKNFPSGGNYFVYGKYISKPKEIIWSLDQLKVHNFEDDRPDNRVYIGNYQFTFIDPDSEFAHFPEDMPENTICIDFFAERIPWLLKEKCQKKLYYPPRWWQLIKRLHEWKRNKDGFRKFRQELTNKLISYFKQNGIIYSQMDEKQIKDYMENWFSRIVPVDKQLEAKNICFSGSDYNCYLWHAFSYEVVPSEKGGIASELYDTQNRRKCVLLLNFEKIGFVLENTAALTSEVLSQYNDIIITDFNYDWSYVHTHEEYCGPYYWKRENIHS